MCERSLAALERSLGGSTAALNMLVVTTADAAAIDAVQAFKASPHVRRVTHEVAEKLYHTHTMPFAYLIDPQGIVVEKGAPIEGSSIQKFVAGVDTDVTNLGLSASASKGSRHEPGGIDDAKEA
jgi:hypothetical protein